MKILKICCVYVIRSVSCPNKIYVGGTTNFYQRKHSHLSGLRKNKHNPKLMSHVEEYGLADLKFEIIERVKDKSTLINREQFYIDTLLPVFNIDPLANSRLGSKTLKTWTHTEETKKRMSEAAKGIIKRKSGFKHSEETKRKMRVSQSDRSIEWRQKISLNKSGGKNHSARKVIDIKTGQVYDCAVDAAKKNNIGRSQLYHWLHGRNANKSNFQYQ